MIKFIFLLSLIGHILGDFYFQSNKLALAKNKHFTPLLRHSLIYLFIMIVVIIPFFNFELFRLSLLLGAVHFLIDTMKFLYTRKRRMSVKLETTSFIIDQLAHFLTISFVIYFYSFDIEGNFLIDLLEGQLLIDPSQLLAWILTILLIIRPFSILIKKVLTHYRPSNAEEVDGYPNAGALIGVLERFIILMLLSVNQYSAIGFVLTAKSIARYNKIAENPMFSEYYLLGTLLSALLVIIAHVVIF